ncbi:MAG TPA: polyamine aminopropyltransferase [bacterium]|nr:polyamine aminopropyltransferase [bacterium]
MRGAWIVDQGVSDITSAFKITRCLHDERTPYQHLEIYDSPRFGRMLVLDGAVQTTEGDEFVYHEMLAHPALCAHPRPRTVLIIGGGDGGLLEEVLKHPIERATMVEIDAAVVRASRQYLSTICGAAFEDPRATLVIGDGIAYVRETPDRFDVVLIDSTDPEGAATGLFAPEFYAQVANRLTPQGVLAVQSGSAVYQQELIRMVRRHLRPSFPTVRTYVATVTTYPGVLWSFTVGTKGRDPHAIAPEEIARRVAAIAGLRYYTPSGHRAAFDLPPYLREQVEME